MAIFNSPLDKLYVKADYHNDEGALTLIRPAKADDDEVSTPLSVIAYSL
ncbi:MAG: hypothetical protein FWE37_00065 [Spirochaetaceae bacterium]|nr:hypothetical protein [Spirochaetaceae bacterium]